jgi:hypothetical protein
MSERGQKMAIGVSAAEVLPAWLELGDADVLPEAVQAVYAGLAPGIRQTCERARKRMGAGYLDYLRGLRDARDALAKDGKFKEWCAAYGLNYGTVKNQLSQADSKLADNDSLSARSLDSTVKSAQLAVRFADAMEKAEMIARLRELQAAAGVKADDWREALVYLLDYWYEHEHPKEAAAA